MLTWPVRWMFITVIWAALNSPSDKVSWFVHVLQFEMFDKNFAQICNYFTGTQCILLSRPLESSRTVSSSFRYQNKEGWLSISCKCICGWNSPVPQRLELKELPREANAQIIIFSIRENSRFFMACKYIANP